ncbi:ABC transporter ATP-binding protein [Natrialba swarupiae]|uniref:Molybdate/tungstate import ATP-binding protein WtpC n=1 Tax=Natrialba swarupiae TaxID=2448032 RepID=A0A5D5AQH6_9EURY|nr:ABC transporter ATP-binding protein [Natrialba swarupiae]TYT63999.1 ABC transporter ATP-binding protein [Natrialba swarupiae]
MAEVTLEKLHKRYGDETAVESLDFTVHDGETLGVVGPSGCGKTTTLRMIAGFETPTDGVVRFDSEDVTHVPPEKRNVGLVFQSYALFNNMSVLANVAFGLKMEGVGKEERRERAQELLDMLGIGDLGDRSPESLSGGQQQRVGLARALAIEPDILLLDEPMTGLDAKLKTRLRTEMSNLLEELGVTALYVTHDQEEAMAMCDRIAVLNDGHIEQIGTPDTVYEQPANTFVANFIGTSNVLRGKANGDSVDLGFTRVQDERLEAVNGEATLIARPEAFDVDDDGFEAQVRDVHYLGERIQATAELPDGTDLTLKFDSFDRQVSADDVVSLALDLDDVHVVD